MINIKLNLTGLAFLALLFSISSLSASSIHEEGQEANPSSVRPASSQEEKHKLYSSGVASLNFQSKYPEGEIYCKYTDLNGFIHDLSHDSKGVFHDQVIANDCIHDRYFKSENKFCYSLYCLNGYYYRECYNKLSVETRFKEFNPQSGLKKGIICPDRHKNL